MTIQQELESGCLGRPGLVRIHRWHEHSEELASQFPNLLAEEIDLACLLFGNAPEFVFAKAFDDSKGRSGIVCHLGFAEGMAIIDCVQRGDGPYYSLSLIGSDGAAYADDHHNTNLFFKNGTQGTRMMEEQEWLRFQLEAFARSIQSDDGQRASIEDLQRAIAIADIALKSASSNRAATRIGERYELQ